MPTCSSEGECDVKNAPPSATRPVEDRRKFCHRENIPLPQTEERSKLANSEGSLSCTPWYRDEYSIWALLSTGHVAKMFGEAALYFLASKAVDLPASLPCHQHVPLRANEMDPWNLWIRRQLENTFSPAVTTFLLPLHSCLFLVFLLHRTWVHIFFFLSRRLCI